MSWWKQQPPFDRTSLFTERLSADGITEEELAALLCESEDALRARAASVPGWMEVLARITGACKEGYGPGTGRGHAPNGRQGLARLLEPFEQHGETLVRAGLSALLRECGAFPFEPDMLAGGLRRGLRLDMTVRLARTLALEVNLARLEARLEGDTPTARFEHFIDQLTRAEAIAAFFREYPVLGRQLVVAAEHWVAQTLEFARHLCADRDEISAVLGGGANPGMVTRVEADAAETHRRGRRVLTVQFESGLQVVYKPKALAADAHFQELLAWVNARVGAPRFRTIRVLDRGSYGWTECVEPATCGTAAKVALFYERLGGLLALVYALEGTDFHCENIVAAGEHPVIVDLEALFQPRVEGYAVTAHGDPAISTLGFSVLRTGLLPERTGASEHGPGIDASGVGGQPGQRSPRPVDTWEAFGTDEMRLVRRHIALDGANNRPTLNGQAVKVASHLDDVLRGFESTYRLLMHDREDLIAGPLHRFRRDPVRVIVRSTKTYNILISQSYHPDFLRDALDRDRFLDHLWQGVELRPFLARLVPAERADVRDGDVPLFTTRADSRDLWTSSGDIIAGVFDAPSWDLVCQRIRQLSEHDLRLQCWFIRASFATLLLEQASAPWRRSGVSPAGGDAERAPARDELLAAAGAVGDRLRELALRDRDAVSWVGLGVEDDRGWQVEPAGIDLYSGTPGIALFLAYLGAVSTDARYTGLARSALASARRQLELLQRWRQPLPLGTFTGLGGVIYVLLHLAALWDEPLLLDEAEALADALPQLIDADDTYDVVGGTAGCVGALLGLHAVRPRGPALELAIRCGDHLVERAQPAGSGLGWLNPRVAHAPLTGFAHGVAGIAWSLFALAGVTGDDRYRHTAVRALAYERGLFRVEERNWPDLRRIAVRNGAPAFAVAWCHGAAGIGLGRLASLGICDDPRVREEITHAIETTIASGFGLNHCLCHGDLGNLELIQLAAEILGHARYGPVRDRVTSSILKSIGNEGWRTGLPLGLESPGLMSGLAGIGYALLRLARPDVVPSVLLLAPPSELLAMTSQRSPQFRDVRRSGRHARADGMPMGPLRDDL